jgi:antitoxin (DNA-binding transcriptional repressor) of toxin-antitoxin stability system
MKKLNIHEAKTHLSGYLEDLANGEVIILCKRNVPVAEIRGITSREGKRPRPTGLAWGEFKVPEAFFDPLPDDVLAAFTGESL